MRWSPRISKRTLGSLVLALGALVVVGVIVLNSGGSSSVYEGSPPPDYEEMLADAPAPLASVYDEANELLPGGTGAFDEQIAELNGFPVVVNVWASWCGPCRAEFPHLQQVSANLGKEVAFLGVNSQDSESAAATFLELSPLPYPSFSDPDKKITESLDVGRGLPATAFFNADGELTFTKPGQYRDEAELEADIERYGFESG